VEWLVDSISDGDFDEKLAGLEATLVTSVFLSTLISTRHEL